MSERIRELALQATDKNLISLYTSNKEYLEGELRAVARAQAIVEVLESEMKRVELSDDIYLSQHAERVIGGGYREVDIAVLRPMLTHIAG